MARCSCRPTPISTSRGSTSWRLGFDEIYLHHVGQEQREWLEVFGEQVLPKLDVTSRAAS